nr:ATP-binding protein [Amycolatopsis taiwanensis]
MIDPELAQRLAELEQRVRQAISQRRCGDSAPEDPFRGLYLSEAAIEELLRAPRGPLPAAPPAPGGPRLTRLAAAAGLSELDLALLLVALAPDVDSRFEQFYGYLNDDVTRRRATVGLALRLCGLPEAGATGRSRLTAGAPLARAGLLVLTEPDRPLLSRELRLPDRVVAYLLGDDQMAPALAGSVRQARDPLALAGATRLARALAGGVRLIYLTDSHGHGAAELGARALAEAGYPALLTAARTDSADWARALRLEALLGGAGLVVGPLTEADPAALLAELAHPAIPVLVYGTRPWEPGWSQEPPLLQEVIPPAPADIATLWRSTVDGQLAEGVDPAEVTAQFRLSPEQIRAAAVAAVQAAAADAVPVDAGHLRAGARGCNAGGLHRLARRIEPAVGWPALVLPEPILGQLRELADRARYRELVLTRWRMRPGGGRGRGVVALFAGDSGTGKTMSAEVIAGALGLDLYTVNLATVVDKYVGETEKNLERIFAEAAGVNGVLLFDEADAIFGKRSDVRDAHDRYANIESAYLLQRMETFDGIAIMATNLRANLDEAFTRRLDVVVDFPAPDTAQRLLLWERCLGERVPRAADLDLDFLAGSFDLTGGHIRSAVVTAAYLAAAAHRPVGMAELVGAVAREYRKLGRLQLAREFGPYLDLLP